MASIGIITSTSDLYNTNQPAAATKADTASTTASQEDTVKLSAQAQAKLLHSEGLSVSTIAASLGTDTKTVDSYLGVTLTKELTKELEATEAASA
jgi:DNA-binding NarL/FixJ family response regulator